MSVALEMGAVGSGGMKLDSTAFFFYELNGCDKERNIGTLASVFQKAM